MDPKVASSSGKPVFLFLSLSLPLYRTRRGMPPLNSIMKDEEEFLFPTFAARISQRERSIVIHPGRESSRCLHLYVDYTRDVIYARIE